MLRDSLWAYNPHNHDHIGDDVSGFVWPESGSDSCPTQWNAENFSWYADNQRDKDLQGRSEKGGDVGGEDLDAGGRLLDAIVVSRVVLKSGRHRRP
jgi:hypothetical protein